MSAVRHTSTGWLDFSASRSPNVDFNSFNGSDVPVVHATSTCVVPVELDRVVLCAVGCVTGRFVDALDVALSATAKLESGGVRCDLNPNEALNFAHNFAHNFAIPFFSRLLAVVWVESIPLQFLDQL